MLIQSCCVEAGAKNVGCCVYRNVPPLTVGILSGVDSAGVGPAISGNFLLSRDTAVDEGDIFTVSAIGVACKCCTNLIYKLLLKCLIFACASRCVGVRLTLHPHKRMYCDIMRYRKIVDSILRERYHTVSKLSAHNCLDISGVGCVTATAICNPLTVEVSACRGVLDNKPLLIGATLGKILSQTIFRTEVVRLLSTNAYLVRNKLTVRGEQ